MASKHLLLAPAGGPRHPNLPRLSGYDVTAPVQLIATAVAQHTRSRGSGNSACRSSLSERTPRGLQLNSCHPPSPFKILGLPLPKGGGAVARTCPSRGVGGIEGAVDRDCELRDKVGDVLTLLLSGGQRHLRPPTAPG